MPLPFLTINTVGKTIMEFGSEEQKKKFLPKILAGECHFSIGYTEPGAGTDLASLRTTAVKDGDEWVINGQKIYTSLASYADYIWLAARTDPDAPKHKGITIFLVPTTDPGFSWTKIHTMVNASTTSTYYNDVRVGDDAVVYGVNRGWDLITNQLNYERMSLAPPGMVERCYDDVGPVGAGDEAARRTACHRPGVGAAQPGPGAGEDRVPEAHQLEGVHRQDESRCRQLGQGLRDRVLHRGVSPAARGRRARRASCVRASPTRRSPGGSSAPCRGH